MLLAGGVRTYERTFYEQHERGKHVGQLRGFPMQRGAWCQDRLKGNILDRCAKADIRKDILSCAVPQWGGQRNLRISDGQGSVVQQLPQTECPAEITGFATRWSQYCTGELKRSAITDSRFQYIGETGVLSSRPEFSNSARSQGAGTNIVQYLGIAADEPERIARHTKPGIILPLVEAGWDEAYCRQWCSEYSLLSPIYTSSSRGGCWFCHNQTINQLRLLRKDYPDLWSLLMKWDIDSPVTFKADGHTVHDFDRRFQLEDEGKIPSDRKFRWKMMEEYK